MLLKTLLICTQISGSTSLLVLHLYRYYISTGITSQVLDLSSWKLPKAFLPLATDVVIWSSLC